MTVTIIEAIASPLRHIDAGAVSRAARAETRNREVYLPPVSVFRWWARRTEAVNGAVIDAVTAERGSDEPLLVVDPFAGGGVIPLAALIRGHRVYAQDINPWAAAGLDRHARTPGTSSNPGGRRRSSAADNTTSHRRLRHHDDRRAARNHHSHIPSGHRRLRGLRPPKPALPARHGDSAGPERARPPGRHFGLSQRSSLSRASRPK